MEAIAAADDDLVVVVAAAVGDDDLIDAAAAAAAGIADVAGDLLMLIQSMFALSMPPNHCLVRASKLGVISLFVFHILRLVSGIFFV